MDRFLLYRTYDELEVGQTQRTRGRTITETDIVNWCALTGDWFYPHIDKVAAERSMFGQRVAPGIMVFALGTGLGVPSDATTILANYGTDRLRYTAPTWINVLTPTRSSRTPTGRWRAPTAPTQDQSGKLGDISHNAMICPAAIKR